MAAREHNSNAASQESSSPSRSEVDADGRHDARRTSEIVGDDRTGDATRVVTIVIAHDHAVVRGGVRRVLEAQEGFEVVGEAGDVATALRKVREHKPNIVVFDLGMPGGGPLGRSRRSSRPRPAPRSWS
jgi:PleD family two-component response regulator